MPVTNRHECYGLTAARIKAVDLPTAGAVTPLFSLKVGTSEVIVRVLETICALLYICDATQCEGGLIYPPAPPSDVRAKVFHALARATMWRSGSY